MGHLYLADSETPGSWRRYAPSSRPSHPRDTPAARARAPGSGSRSRSPRGVRGRRGSRRCRNTSRQRRWQRRGSRSADYFGDGVGDVIDVFGRERRNADPPGIDGVDSVLLAQAAHLLLGKAGVGEHAALLEDEAEVRVRYPLVDAVDQRLAHRLDALAHLAQLFLPQGP